MFFEDQGMSHKLSMLASPNLAPNTTTLVVFDVNNTKAWEAFSPPIYLFIYVFTILP